MFRYVTWPAIVPVSVTVVLIRVIEAFKIIDLPNVLTNGGPGIASESMTLHAYVAWRALDLGGSAAVAYLLLFVVVFVCLSMLALAAPGRERGQDMSGPRGARASWLLRPRSPLEPSPLSMLVSYAILGFWAFVVLFPLYWVFITSFKQPIDVNDGPVLPDVGRLPAVAARLEVHLRRPRPRHLQAVSEQRDRRARRARRSP